MIPVTLSIKNFLSYRDNAPVLDFESIHIACLCGANGHGKSALLDAITWVLWGKARTGHENLIHKGQTDMAVELEFLARDQPYRVSRRHSRSGKGRQGNTVLELQIGDFANSSFRPITGNTINETQARIIDILHMDYDTFINTAFMRQGDADRFTNARPTERKGILSEVLDLSYYEKLEVDAKERVNELGQRIQEIEVSISVHEQELKNKPSWDTQLSAARQEAEILLPKKEAARKAVNSGTQQISRLKNQQSQLIDLDQQLQRFEERNKEIELRGQRHQKMLAAYQALVDRKPEIEQAYVHLTEASDQREHFVRALSKKNPLDQELAELNQIISIERERLSGRISQLRNEIEEVLTPKADRIHEIEDRSGQLEPRRQHLANIQSKVGTDQLELEACSRELDDLNSSYAKKNILEREKLKLQTKIDMEQLELQKTAETITDSIENNFRPKAGRLEKFESESKDLELARDEIDNQSGEISISRSRLDEIDAQIVILEHDGENLIRTMQDTRRKFDMLEAGTSLCPVCMQALGDEGQAHLRSEYEKEGLNSRKSYSDNKAQQSRKSLERSKLVDTIKLMEADHQTRRYKLESDAGRIRIEIANAKKAKEELVTLTLRCKELEAQLAALQFAPSERNELEKIEAKLQLINFDARRMKQVQVNYRDLGGNLTALQSQLNQESLVLQRETDNLEREHKEARNALIQLTPAREELDALENKLESENYAIDIRKKAVDLERSIETLAYDHLAHSAVDKIVSKLNEYEELYRSLHNAIENLPLEQDLLAAACYELSLASEERSLVKEKRNEIDHALQTLPYLERELREDTFNSTEIESNLSECRITIGVLESRILRCREVENLINGLQSDRSLLIDERSLYAELVLAFGKNGIQALIIEDAIPQLESDANELLGRLTDNRMTLRLELKEGRRVRGTDALSEELDLSISDELGTRGYETFSGGETFRINFALRIALSRLLARRSGAPLRILFIDEGFGSQDTTGQESLTEAIQFIQSDFEKIIVITHIDHIKEAFPVRIEVTKTDLGSTFEVV